MSKQPDWLDAMIEAINEWLIDACALIGVSVTAAIYAHLAGIAGAATELDYYGSNQ